MKNKYLYTKIGHANWIYKQSYDDYYKPVWVDRPKQLGIEFKMTTLGDTDQLFYAKTDKEAIEQIIAENLCDFL